MRAAVVACAAALVVGVVAPGAATAADPEYTAYGQVLLEGASSSRGVDVYLKDRDKAAVYVDTTDSNGNWSVTGGHEVMDAQIYFVDSARQYVTAAGFRETTYNDHRVIDTVEMHLGGEITGRVLAPSGRPLKNAKVAYVSQYGSGDAWSDIVDRTTADGQYVIAPVERTWLTTKVTLGTAIYGSSSPALPPFGEPGPDGMARATGQDFTGIKAPVTISLTGTSPSKGRATLKVSVSAATYGLPGPGGKVTIYDSTRVVKRNVTLSSTGKATISLSGLGRRTHSFWLKFSGATDTLAKTSAKRYIAVK